MNPNLAASYRFAAAKHAASAIGYRANAVQYPKAAKTWLDQAALYDRFAAEGEARAVEVEQSPIDLERIYNLDKVAIRSVSAEHFERAVEARQYLYSWFDGPRCSAGKAFFGEVTRRKAAATRAARAGQEAARQAEAATFVVGEAVQVHAFGYWYNGEVVRIAKTGTVVCRYTSGSGVTREKSVGADKVRKLGAK